MTQTTRRVAVTLVSATDENAHQVMAGMLDAVRNALPALAVVGTSTHAFDLAEDDEPEPCVQLVIDSPGIVGAYVDNPERADEHARNIGGVVVELPVTGDHRERA
ncbi:hypothetical protein [Actinomadura litoris]|uniref:hypothetical protein n=1 Tax=Actinomadura litoris TaxID=2678616 RepID=UPI001FA793BC|nr:hypothetical protein [Actinomadura litoris]